MNSAHAGNSDKLQALRERLSVLNHDALPIATPYPSDLTLGEWIVAAVDVMRYIRDSKATLFRLDTNANLAQSTSVNRGAQLLQRAAEVDTVKQFLTKNHVIHPWAKLLLEEADKRGSANFVDQNLKSEDARLRYTAYLNDFVDQLRWQLEFASVKIELKEIQRRNRNYARDLQSYFLNLIDQSSDIRIARMEINFKTGGEEGYDGLFLRRLQEMLRSVQADLGDSFCGYAWKRDFGRLRGGIVHLVIAAIDNVVLETIMTRLRFSVTALALGTCHDLTRGAGSYFNYRAARNGSDPQLLSEELRRAHFYLTATDDILLYGSLSRVGWAECGPVHKSGGTKKVSGQSSTVMPSGTAGVDRSSIGTASTATIHDDVVILGASERTHQFGILGSCDGRRIALDLNDTHTTCLFGVPGFGKSYTLGAIAEMASMQVPSVNNLRQGLATMAFHYSDSMSYEPEFAAMTRGNSDLEQVQRLKEDFGASPKALSDVVMLVPDHKLEERRISYPSVEIHPLIFSSSELTVAHWRILMGAVGNSSSYVRQILNVLKSSGAPIKLEVLRTLVESSDLSDQQKRLARIRIDFASEYIQDTVPALSSLIRAGRLVIVDLRHEYLDKGEALGLFLVLLQLFAGADNEIASFNKLAIFDEVHKYAEDSELMAGLSVVVREMRHRGVSILLSSQDPFSLPKKLIELADQVILHRIDSPDWLKHLQGCNSALRVLTPHQMANLQVGEAYVWSNKATDAAFQSSPVKIQCRPRITMHGGSTKTAVR